MVLRLAVLACLAAFHLLGGMAAANPPERTVAVAPGGFFPVLVTDDRGDLVAVVRGGAPHVGVGGRLDLVRSDDGGRTWSKPVTVADEPPDSRNPAFGSAGAGRLVVAYWVRGEYREGRFDGFMWGRYTAWGWTSDDRGRTWSERRQVDTAP
ncbi:MAG: sialidase family protein, partial [Pirellulales bacterium]